MRLELQRGRLAWAAAVTMAMTMAAAAQQGAAPPAPAAEGARRPFSDNFTGKIAVQDSKEMRMSRIRFEAGARTNWHVHDTAQLIVFEEGRGRIFELGGTIVDLPAGTPYYTKPNVPHWHGAAPDTHAVQFTVYSGNLDWQEPVTDDQYMGRAGR